MYLASLSDDEVIEIIEESQKLNIEPRFIHFFKLELITRSGSDRIFYDFAKYKY